MSAMDSELLHKIRQQFDSSPYPRISLDKSPKDDANALYIHNLATAYYLRNQKVISTQDKVILDAGCGSGYKSLILAEANPGAKIVGVDISEASVKLAEQRLKYHGFDDAEFHVISVENLSELGYQFDYINCDETLYFFPSISNALKAMKSVLKPDGIIRGNLHSALQRESYFRTQKLFSVLGVMDSNPEDLEIEVVIETMEALKDDIPLKKRVWATQHTGESGKSMILANHLLQGDRGYTIPDMFAALADASLEFISMTNWRKWDFRDLFKDPEELPFYLSIRLPDMEIEERLHLYELINPVHRLLDFWCGHPEQSQGFVASNQWSESDWQKAIVYIHPQLNSSRFREDLQMSIERCKTLELKKYLPVNDMTVTIDSSVAICLLPLLDAPQSIQSLVERWQKCRPVNPISLQPTVYSEAFNLIKQVISELELLDYLMIAPHQ